MASSGNFNYFDNLFRMLCDIFYAIRIHCIKMLLSFGKYVFVKSIITPSGQGLIIFHLQTE